MGYTIQNKKIVIWTEKIFVADPYPFNQEGENHTLFFKNLKDKKPFTECLSSVGEARKQEIVSKLLELNIKSFVLKSKREHYKLRFKR